MAELTFPHPCCRCGYCCMCRTCRTGQEVYGVAEFDPCPGLYYEPNGDDGLIAVCEIASICHTGVGAGCCIKATAYARGVAYDFAALPPAAKRGIAWKYLEVWLKKFGGQLRRPVFERKALT